MDIRNIQDKLRDHKELSQYEPEELNYLITSPMGKAYYEHPKETPSEKHWSDMIECKDCGKKYMRSRGTQHRRTKYHQVYEKMNKKLRDLLIND